MFLILAYPTEDNKNISKILNRSLASIRSYVCKAGIKKINKVKEGDEFGYLKVKKLFEIKREQKIWECICKCGKVHYITTRYLYSGHTQSCGCLRIENMSLNYGGAVSGVHLGKIKKSALHRNIEFNITLDYVNKLLVEQNNKCALSGLDIIVDTRIIDGITQTTTASLDRIDSKKGYIEGNLQWVHKDINYMKNDYSQEYFINICKLIAEKHKSNDTNSI